MRTLILYSTKSGCARACAELIAARIEGSECHEIKAGAPLIAQADLVVLGSGVHAGRMYKPFRKCVNDNLDLLLGRKLAFYSCNALPGTLGAIVEKNIPARLAAHALSIESLGGKKPFVKADGLEWLETDAFERLIAALA
jgi:menaquinone-dependent protoporphyrinogen IX oxidase